MAGLINRLAIPLFLVAICTIMGAVEGSVLIGFAYGFVTVLFASAMAGV